MKEKMNPKTVNLIFKAAYIAGVILALIGCVWYMFIQKRILSFTILMLGGFLCISSLVFNPKENGVLKKDIKPRVFFVVLYLALIICLMIMKGYIPWKIGFHK